MLKHTFVHIPGIGLQTEKRLWRTGIRTWEEWSPSAVEGRVGRNRSSVEEYIQASRDSLRQKNPRFFGDRLPANLQWRLFPDFRGETAYLDIETTGLSDWENAITTIALYDGKRVFYYINGENLHRFPDDILRYAVLVTYNGKTFDIPFIERYFGIRLECAHIDLRYVLHSLGLKGGLKGCERALGIRRGDLEGVDGYFAVLLWQEYIQRKNFKALETLLAYNIADVLSLERLMITAYNLKIKDTPFFRGLCMETPPMPENPFSADRNTLFKIRRALDPLTGMHIPRKKR